MAEEVEKKSLRELFAPITANPPSCIVLPHTTAAHFELRPNIIQLLPNFHGFDNEHPYQHVKDFLDICATFRYQNFSDDSIRLRLFPFSLKDKAKAWLNSLPSGSITSWDILMSKFLSKFFPISKTNALRREIADFCQEENEKFYEGWERFKDLLLKCPHHGFETWRLVQYFYNGLTQSNRNMIESMNGGGFLSLNDDQAYEFLERLSESSQQWDFSSHRDKPTSQPKKGGLYEVRDDSDVRSKLDSLSRRVEALALNRTVESVNRIQVEPCSLCASPMHTSEICPSMAIYSEQVNALHDYQKSSGSPFSETYNSNWRNHPNFSWKQNQTYTNSGGQPSHQTNYPPGFRPPTHTYPNQNFPSSSQATQQFVAPQQQQSSLEDSLKAFMQVTGQAIVELKNSTSMNTQAIAKLESQVGQLANQMGEREKGKFPSQAVPNPKGQYAVGSSSNPIQPQEQCQAVITLRSGKQIDNQMRTPEEEENQGNKDKSKNVSSDIQNSKPSSSTPVDNPIRSFVPRAPFPQRLLQPKKGTSFGSILDVFKNVQINIPLLHAIEQIPSYSKFLKDLVTVKRRTNVPKKAFLTEHISSIIQCRMPVKYKDPGCPTISCIIGDHEIDRALLDLGASVNLLPYAVYLQLGIGELKPTNITLQLADRSVKIPRGVVEDVLIKVDKFYFPVDFVVLDTQPVKNSKGQIPVILGRPFLATSNALINCRSGVMKLSFGNMQVDLNIFDISKKMSGPDDDYDEVSEICMIDGLIEDTLRLAKSEDPFESCLAHFNYEGFDIEESIEQVNALLDFTPRSNDRCQQKAISLSLHSSSIDSFNLECEEESLRHIHSCIEETSEPKVIESQHFSHTIVTSKPKISFVVHSNKYWEDKFRKVKVDPLRLRNTEDEFERLIFNPGIPSLLQNINVKSNQRNDNVTILYDLTTFSHDNLDIVGDTLIEDSGNPFDTVDDSYCVFSDKFVKAPYEGDVIDLIIPILHPHMNSTLLLMHANYFPFLYLMLDWKHVRQKKKNRLGDYPYWKMFGSMEFMPTSSRVTFFLLRIESSNNT